MNRRSFLSRLAGAAAIIGLAPRLAFRVPAEPIAQLPIRCIYFDEHPGWRDAAYIRLLDSSGAPVICWIDDDGVMRAERI
jgi:hypothetical protein